MIFFLLWAVNILILFFICIWIELYMYGVRDSVELDLSISSIKILCNAEFNKGMEKDSIIWSDIFIDIKCDLLMVFTDELAKSYENNLIRTEILNKKIKSKIWRLYLFIDSDSDTSINRFMYFLEYQKLILCYKLSLSGNIVWERLAHFCGLNHIEQMNLCLSNITKS
ncbi:hypothetical protein ACJX0J_022510 [Zea mays]